MFQVQLAMSLTICKVSGSGIMCKRSSEPLLGARKTAVRCGCLPQQNHINLDVNRLRVAQHSAPLPLLFMRGD